MRFYIFCAHEHHLRLISAPIVVFVASMQSVRDLQALLYKFFRLHSTSGPLLLSLDVPR